MESTRSNMDNIIDIHIEDQHSSRQTLEIPTDVNLSLMEILKGSGYEILATCGGMALCATCHIEIVQGAEHLPTPEDQELDMLDTLPDADDASRLACQIRLKNENHGLTIKLKDSQP